LYSLPTFILHDTTVFEQFGTLIGPQHLSRICCLSLAFYFFPRSRVSPDYKGGWSILFLENRWREVCYILATMENLQRLRLQLKTKPLYGAEPRTADEAFIVPLRAARMERIRNIEVEVNWELPQAGQRSKPQHESQNHPLPFPLKSTYQVA